MPNEEYEEEEPEAGSIICDHCGYENNIYDSACLAC